MVDYEAKGATLDALPVATYGSHVVALVRKATTATTDHRVNR